MKYAVVEVTKNRKIFGFGVVKNDTNPSKYQAPIIVYNFNAHAPKEAHRLALATARNLEQETKP